MKSFQFIEGVWVSCEALPLDDRAFRYGMSVFETVAVAAGRVLFLEEHLSRLAAAALARGWSDVRLPDCLPEITQGVEAPATGVVRLYLTAGPGGVSDPAGGSMFALIEGCEVGTDFSSLRVASLSAPYVPGPGGWKTGNYWQNVDALLSARRAGCDEGLLFNPCGALVSASMANVFLQLDGRWVTPARETGARDGVVRAWVIGQIPVDEEMPGASDLARCTACFLTNSRMGIRAVGELDGRPLSVEMEGLQASYREEVLRS